MDQASDSMFVRAQVVATAEDEISHKLGVKVWFEGICTAKKTGITSMMKNVKPKVVYVLPGRLCMIKSEIDPSLRIQAALTAEKCISINAQLKATASGKEMTLEYPDETGVKLVKETFTFETNDGASGCVAAIQNERTWKYVHSENFSPKFEEDLNSVIRMKIDAGDEPLREMYLSCYNRASPSTAIEALFTNYRTMQDFEESAVSFGDLLSAVANDPVVLIIFLCCVIDAGRSMNEHFSRMCGHEIDSSAELFEKLLQHVCSTVSKPEWKLKRELLLNQFQYPVSATAYGTSGITTFAVYTWTVRFTENYKKFPIDIHVLNRMLVDEKYLCFVCLQHHAAEAYTDIVQAVFPTVPQEYLFSAFDTDVAAGGAGAADAGEDEDAQADNPWGKPAMKRSASAHSRTLRPHFVDFLFHRNLSRRDLFLNLLMAFKRGDGYDDKFFIMFLTEAISKDRPRVAVDVITKLLFLENGECSVHALKLCPKIAVILFDALVSGILNSGSAGHSVSDDMRLLFEVAIRFQYFALKKELNYLKTLDRLFKEKPEKVDQFMALVNAMKFLPYAIDVVNHNLSNRDSPREGPVRMPGAVAAGAGGYHHQQAPPRTDSSGNMHRATATASAAASTSASTAQGEDDEGDIAAVELNNGSEQEDGGDNASMGSLPKPPSVHSQQAAGPATGDSRYGSTDMGDNSSVHSRSFSASATSAFRPNDSFLAQRRLSVNPNTSGQGGFSEWKVRTDGNLVAFVYGFLTLLIACGELPQLKDKSVKENEYVSKFLEAMVPGFYTHLLQPNTALRVRLTDFLREKFKIVALYSEILSQPMMLRKHQHFRYSFLHALSYDAHFLTDCMVALITVAVMLEQYDDLYTRLHEIDVGLGRSKEQQQRLEVILHHVMDRDPAELVRHGIQLQHLAAFATAEAEALKSCHGNAEREHAVIDRAQRLLVEAPVAEWETGFTLEKLQG